jgi:protein involved in polysaccharide export with SLBB domain
MGSVGKRRVKDNDVIRIPAYSQRVTVEGQVKRPGIFEMKQESRFLIYYHLPQDLLRLPIQPQ